MRRRILAKNDICTSKVGEFIRPDRGESFDDVQEFVRSSRIWEGLSDVVVEPDDPIGVDPGDHALACLKVVRNRYSGDHRRAAEVERQQYRIALVLKTLNLGDGIDGSDHRAFSGFERSDLDVLGADAQERSGRFDREKSRRFESDARFRDQVHRRIANERGDEPAVGTFVKLARGRYLDQSALIEDGDPMTNGDASPWSWVTWIKVVRNAS